MKNEETFIIRLRIISIKYIVNVEYLYRKLQIGYFDERV